VLDGKLLPACENLGEIVFSADGSKLAYAALTADKWQVVLDGRPQPPCNAIGQGSLCFAAGDTLVYAAQTEQKWRLLAGGRESKPFSGITAVRVSPSGKLLAYVAQVDGGEAVVLDGRQQQTLERIRPVTLTFSPDSGRLAYVGRAGRGWVAVVDGKRQPRYDRVGCLTFSPDSKHFVYAAGKEGQAVTVVDDRPSAHRYEALWNVPAARFIFDGRKTFHYLAVQAGNVLLVEEEIE
jgi:hypothetical protein